MSCCKRTLSQQARLCINIPRIKIEIQQTRVINERLGDIRREAYIEYSLLLEGYVMSKSFRW